jgi:pyruvate,orthophosphate dikinase
MPAKSKSKKASSKTSASARKSASPKAPKYVYTWGAGKADGDGKMKALLGGKGANLAEMTRIGLPVPPGFTITTEVCTWFNAHGKTCRRKSTRRSTTPSSASRRSRQGLRQPGQPAPLRRPLRARDSMPGMMDTILNLGLNDETVQGLIAASANERFAYDCYRRFIQMYGDVVMGVQKRAGEHHEPFERSSRPQERSLPRPPRKDVSDTELDASSLKELVVRFKKLVRDRTGKRFSRAIRTSSCAAPSGAVFGSWNNERAIVYRQKYNIPNEWGTAVNVQAMVFGNTGDESCSGVAFTRDPATGEKVFYGEYLINAQGEDVVAGVRTPDPVATLQEKCPRPTELEDVRASLEKHFREMQDFEFTVENGKLFMLQTRNGKRTGVAAVRIAVEMVKEKLITWQEAVARVPADQLSQLLTPIFDRKAIKHAEKIASGLPAGPGAATGRIYFNANEAEAESPRARCSWCARKRRRKTSAACSRPKASSPPAAASAPTRRSSRARWARSASAAPARCTSITTTARSPSAIASSTRATSSPSTAPAAKSTPAKSRPPRRKSSRC